MPTYIFNGAFLPTFIFNGAFLHIYVLNVAFLHPYVFHGIFIFLWKHVIPFLFMDWRYAAGYVTYFCLFYIQVLLLLLSLFATIITLSGFIISLCLLALLTDDLFELVVDSAEIIWQTGCFQDTLFSRYVIMLCYYVMLFVRLTFHTD